MLHDQRDTRLRSGVLDPNHLHVLNPVPEVPLHTCRHIQRYFRADLNRMFTQTGLAYGWKPVRFGISARELPWGPKHVCSTVFGKMRTNMELSFSSIQNEVLTTK